MHFFPEKGNKKRLSNMEENFNSKLQNFTPQNADKTIFYLGNPSNILLNVGIEDKPLKLFGSKLLKKIKKHGFKATDLMDLPNYIADPIAIFEGGRPRSFSILTEIVIGNDNVVVIIEVGKDKDMKFNVITSIYGKAKEGIANWVGTGKLLYLNKEKAPNCLNLPALIAGAASNQGLEP